MHTDDTTDAGITADATAFLVDTDNSKWGVPPEVGVPKPSRNTGETPTADREEGPAPGGAPQQQVPKSDNIQNDWREMVDISHV